MELTPKQKAFIAEYILDLNATQAAIRAGFSKKTAESQGSRLLRNVKVLAEIDRLKKEREERTLVTADWVVANLKEVVERCMTHEPVMQFDHEEKRMVQKQGEDPETGKTVGIYEFDSAGANRALELLGKHLALFTEKHEHTGAGGGPIAIKNDVDLSRLTDAQLIKLADSLERNAPKD